MADSIALVGVVISFVQLIIGLGALASRKSAMVAGDKSSETSPPGAVGRTLEALAANRQALDALLIAAVCVLFASVMLFLVEDTVDARLDLEAEKDPRLNSNAEFKVAIFLGGAFSLAGIVHARRAWSQWLDGGDQMLGVVLAVMLTVLAGVLGIFLATRWGVFD